MPEVIERQECSECGADLSAWHAEGCSRQRRRVLFSDAVTVRYVRERQSADDGKTESIHHERQPVPVTEEMARDLAEVRETLVGLQRRAYVQRAIEAQDRIIAALNGGKDE